MKKLTYCTTVLLLSLGIYASANAAEPTANSIRSVTTQQVGDQFYVSVEFADALPEVPTGWSTKEPARVVFDFPGVKNESGKAIYAVNSNGLRNLQFVQTEQQTRLVMSLVASRGYEAEVKGKSLLIKFTPFKQVVTSKAAATATANNTITPQTKLPLVELGAVRDLVFRRGEQGQAQILIDLSDGSIPVDIRRSTGGITVDLQDTLIPERLLSKRDVNDFATPVNSITTSSQGNQARIEIAAKGAWQHQAQLVNNQLKIEIRQLTSTELNKLVPHGQEGKKISINFFDADLAMVLRTLA
ncbi:MAG TPA: AMIN domain-containing protein, partial [Rhodocyclaceae bacterium]|nr:AMIN domain-containing protein [Rhodocyclaceae bacterium]